MKKILFVCTGNTCRSPMAEGILNKLAGERNLDVFAKSAGISAAEGSPASVNSVKACDEIGVDISGHRSTQLTNQMFYEADKVVPMTKTHQIIMQDAFKNREKILPALDVPDPFGGDLEEYRLCRDRIKEKIEELLDDSN